MTELSVLDLAPVPEGSSVSRSLANTLDLARHAEGLGYKRYWLAEHHNMPGIASAATAVVIGHVAAGTSTIRVGAGGIMLPNHAPLVIAEQFGTLAALFAGRVDLGLGRAPGTDMATARALRRNLESGVDGFPNDVVELMAYFRPEEPSQRVRAVPGEGQDVEVWILGSSTYGAQLAAILGLPYAFASHFAPAEMEHAIDIYRSRFQPSERLDKPRLMLGLNVFAADSAAGRDPRGRDRHPLRRAARRHVARRLRRRGGQGRAPGRPDPARGHGPSKDGVGLWWKVLGRNKRTITLDLSREPGGRGHPPASSPHRRRVIENFRPGTLEKWDLGLAGAVRRQPAAGPVARVTGFGQFGPYARRPGFGTLAEAMSGFAAITGEPDAPPTLPPFGLADSIDRASRRRTRVLTALSARERTGEGQVVDMAIIEPILAILGPQPPGTTSSATSSRDWATAREQRPAQHLPHAPTAPGSPCPRRRSRSPSA